MVLLPKMQYALSRGQGRKELATKGRIRTIRVDRQMAALQVNNAIRETFKSVSKLKSFTVLEADAGTHLVRAGSQSLNGVGAIERRGSLYLNEDNETQSAASKSEVVLLTSLYS